MHLEPCSPSGSAAFFPMCISGSFHDTGADADAIVMIPELQTVHTVVHHEEAQMPPGSYALRVPLQTSLTNRLIKLLNVLRNLPSMRCASPFECRDCL
jgi:hypothetical protein